MKTTAREFLNSEDSNEFRAACARVTVHSAKDKRNQALEPSVRQVRKWRRRAGAAWKEGRPK
jgi:hypothetical protein